MAHPAERKMIGSCPPLEDSILEYDEGGGRGGGGRGGKLQDYLSIQGTQQNPTPSPSVSEDP